MTKLKEKEEEKARKKNEREKVEHVVTIIKIFYLHNLLTHEKKKNQSLVQNGESNI